MYAKKRKYVKTESKRRSKATKTAGRGRRRYSAKGRNFGAGALTAQHPMASIFASPKVRRTQAVYTFNNIDVRNAADNLTVLPGKNCIVYHVSGSNMYDPLILHGVNNGEIHNNLVPDDVYRPAAGHDTYAQFLEQYCIVGSRCTVRLADSKEGLGQGSGAGNYDYAINWGICSHSNAPRYEQQLQDYGHAIQTGLLASTITADSGQVALSQVVSPSKAFGVKSCKENGKDFDAEFGELTVDVTGIFDAKKPENHTFHTIVIDAVNVPASSTYSPINLDMVIEMEYLFYPRGTKLGLPDAQVTGNTPP